MNIVSLHQSIIDDYKSYIQSFINISDSTIASVVEEAINSGKLWKDPLIQFNPSFQVSSSTEELIKKNVLDAKLADIFAGFSLYDHQVEALTLGSQGKDFIVTSGTGSGKSLTFLGTIFNYLAKNPNLENGVKAIIVYPMNALINSQNKELGKYAKNYFEKTGQKFPFTFKQYTGQEKKEEKEDTINNPPDILLTNYVMLEYILTRNREDQLKSSIYNNLKFIAFDELHTFRGRQGADVGMLIRRIKAKCKDQEISCIGTSATMVSGGTIQSQKEKVAEVASSFFGSSFRAEQIIIEKLQRQLGAEPINVRKLIQDCVAEPGGDISKDFLVNNELIRWLENEIALVEKEGIIIRNKPLSIPEISSKLVDITGFEIDKAKNFVVTGLNWINLYNAFLAATGSKEKSILPLKIHQFISQTGSVYMTLGPSNEPDRHITLDSSPFIVIDDQKKPLFPVVFSRESGKEFYCVTKSPEDQFLPRGFNNWSRTDEEENDHLEGYIIPDVTIWNPEEDAQNLPEAWIRRRTNGQILGFRNHVANRIPVRIFFDDLGNFTEEENNRNYPYEGWYMAAKLLFDPTSGTFYHGDTKESTKLATLGSEGRSTSTTTLIFSILKQMAEVGMESNKQKVLSFTDNRQDAALQSGHFNDFIQTVQIRSAVYRAIENSNNKTLDYSTLPSKLAEAINLNQSDYAVSPGTFPGPIRDNLNALKDFIMYQALQDLRRSWRVVLPNLEQCGLLDFDYKDLREICEVEEHWQNIPVLERLSPDERHDFIFQTLDFFRKEYAIRVEDYLAPDMIETKASNINQRLKVPYNFKEIPKPELGNHIRIKSISRNANLEAVSAGPTSGYGKYFKRLYNEVYPDDRINNDIYYQSIEQIFNILGEAGYLSSTEVVDTNNENTSVYRLNIDYLIWKKGNGETLRRDEVKNLSYRGADKEANQFFKKVYSTDLSNMKKLAASNHTGQITDSDERKRREELFGEGDISALFCSPTMELGIDIASLDIVHMRNVPPNPANYAQRSGRAGRSGQSALVFTYCGSYSAHDRNYYSKSLEMVSGNVVPPTLDLKNEDLLKSHLHAYILSEITLEELNSSIFTLLNELDDLNLNNTVKAKLQFSPDQKIKFIQRFNLAIADFKEELHGKPWFNHDWVETTINRIEMELDHAVQRWINIYKASIAMREDATSIINSGIYAARSPEYRQAERNQKQATLQIDVLKCNDTGNNSFSEFYPYRYLASEGFLPGYNFTRLPVRTFLQDDRGTYISRPRFIALKEFGPRNIIYHDGKKYSIVQMITQDINNNIKQAKAATNSGYFLDGDDFNSDHCPFTGEPLDNDSSRRIFASLLELSETRAIQRENISCAEEERTSQGFEEQVYFNIPGGMDTVRKAILKSGDISYLNLQFIPTAKMYKINTGWKHTTQEGFRIGLNSGFWKNQNYVPEGNEENAADVMLFTWDNADALYIQPVKALKLNKEGVITMQYALKRSIELEFQIESNEIAVTIMGNASNPNIFIYESSEGSLGILSQLIENKDTFKKIINRAIEICRFDDESYQEPASYDDLLSYYNQFHHSIIDRFLIKDALYMLRDSVIEVNLKNDQIDYESQYQQLLTAYDKNSSTEKEFLDYLYQNGLKLPDNVQKRTEGIYTQTDFFYEPDIWVYCDGTPHDQTEIKERDKQIRNAIKKRGEQVWVYYYKDNLAEKITERPDIFKKVK